MDGDVHIERDVLQGAERGSCTTSDDSSTFARNGTATDFVTKHRTLDIMEGYLSQTQWMFSSVISRSVADEVS